MNTIGTRNSVFRGCIGAAAMVLFVAFSVSAPAQKRDRSSPPPSRPSRSQQHESAPSHSSPPAQSHQSAPTQHSNPAVNSSPRQGDSRPNRGGSSVYNGNNRGTGGGSTSTSPHTTSPSNPSPSNPSFGNPSSGNHGNNRPGSTTVYNGNRNAGNNPNATPNGNTRPGSTTVYNGNRNPGGNTNAAPNGNNRPGNNPSFNGNNRPGSNPAGNPGGYNRNVGTYNSNSNRTFPAKATIYHAPGGGQVRTRSDGSIRDVRTSGGAVIHHAPDGYRRVEVQRPGGRVIVASSHGGYGYVQRPLVVSNRTYIQRTYVVHGVSYARVYRPWAYGGFTYHVYTPVHFWSPGFYAYAYNPWARPVYYGWGWSARPWYGYYGGWFTPYPYYASPALWLTDFLIARTLEDAYEARMDARAAAAANAQQNYGATPLTPEVKQAVADEVRRQLDRERNEQQSLNSQAGGPPPLFTGGTQVFVVSSSMDVDTGGGQMCPVSEGDVLQMTAAPPQNAQAAQVVVLASKGNDCRKGTSVMVPLADLQEMQNQMRATIDQGLNDLQSKQGQGGLPTLPSNAAGQPTQAPFASQLQPDSNAASELTQAAQEADRAEQDVVSQSAPSTVTLGQSIQEVEAAFGKPKDIADLGSKRIYVYPNLKVTFVNGRVTDVQ